MNEVEKLYSLAGVEHDYDYFTLFDDKVHKIGRTMHLCKKELKHWLENYQKDYVAIKVIRVDKEYPPFTPEKQLELIEWIIGKYNEVSFSKRGSGYNICIDDGSFIGCHHNDKAFERCLAGDINNLWQSLTEEERKQIKEILSE